jgi:ribosomal protein S6
MAKKATKTTSAETLEPRIYEVGYLLSPAVREEDLAGRVDDLKNSLIKAGASIISEGNPEFIDLAYEMSRIIDNKRVRFNQGYFGWIKFEVGPAELALVKELLDTNTLIIRSLLISTVRENTIVSKKSLGKILKGERQDDAEVSAEAPEVVAEAEVPAEKLDEALDEEIKELVKEA